MLQALDSRANHATSEFLQVLQAPLGRIESRNHDYMAWPILLHRSGLNDFYEPSGYGTWPSGSIKSLLVPINP